MVKSLPSLAEMYRQWKILGQARNSSTTFYSEAGIDDLLALSEQITPTDMVDYMGLYHALFDRATIREDHDLQQLALERVTSYPVIGVIDKALEQTGVSYEERCLTSGELLLGDSLDRNVLSFDDDEPKDIFEDPHLLVIVATDARKKVGKYFQFDGFFNSSGKKPPRYEIHVGNVTIVTDEPGHNSKELMRLVGSEKYGVIPIPSPHAAAYIKSRFIIEQVGGFMHNLRRCA